MTERVLHGLWNCDDGRVVGDDAAVSVAPENREESRSSASAHSRIPYLYVHTYIRRTHTQLKCHIQLVYNHVFIYSMYDAPWGLGQVRRSQLIGTCLKRPLASILPCWRSCGCYSCGRPSERRPPHKSDRKTVVKWLHYDNLLYNLQVSSLWYWLLLYVCV